MIHCRRAWSWLSHLLHPSSDGLLLRGQAGRDVRGRGGRLSGTVLQTQHCDHLLWDILGKHLQTDKWIFNIQTSLSPHETNWGVSAFLRSSLKRRHYNNWCRTSRLLTWRWSVVLSDWLSSRLGTSVCSPAGSGHFSVQMGQSSTTTSSPASGGSTTSARQRSSSMQGRSY